MAKLELVILSTSLFLMASGLSLPTLKFFASDKDIGKLQSSVEDLGKSEQGHEHDHAIEHSHVHEYESAFSTLNLPGLPSIPLPPMPPMPAFLQRPPVKATKTVVVHVTHYEKTHPVCWTVDPHKPPCEDLEAHYIKPTSAHYPLVKPTHHYLNSIPNLHDKPYGKPSKSSVEYKPIVEQELAASEPEVEASEPVAETVKDTSPAESREGRYIQFGTPVVTAGEDFKINEAPQESTANVEEQKDSRIIPRFRASTIYVTSTIYATKTEKIQDHMTATLIIDNCVPVDESIPQCNAPSQPLVDTYGHTYEPHFEEFEDGEHGEKGRLTFLQKLVAQQAAIAEGGAHYAAQVAAQHAAYHAALAHKFHSTAAHIAQNNADNALAAEHAALDAAHHHHQAEHAAQENLVSILNKYTKNKGSEEEHSTEPVKEAAKPSEQQDHWRIVTEDE